MKITKRLISMLLTLALFVGMVSVTAQAEETQATVESGNTTIEGTNGFGNLLSQDLQEEQTAQEDDYSGGYNVIGLTIEGGVATVEYDSMEEAVLVVALYSEDGMQLLVSGNTMVDPENTVATVELEGDIPEYFMASAYLMDTFDYSPLCSAYDTPMYTKEMQDLLASTVEDYDADEVLNLDNDNTTNFAVFAETTKVLEYTEGVNTVISADDETLTYIIGNADENITSLQVGDVLAYPYGEDQILIVKVASLTIDGTTATIIGADLEMEEVFSQVKIENESTTSDFSVDDSELEEGVTFEGLVDNGAAYTASPRDTTVNVSKSIAVALEKTVKTGDDVLGLSATVKGSLKLQTKGEFTYYVSFRRQFLEFKASLSSSVSIDLSGKLKLAIPLPKLSYTPVPGVDIGFTPEFQVEVSGKMEISSTWTAVVGFSYESGKGFQNLSTTPKADVGTTSSGKIFIGLDLCPIANVLGGKIIKLRVHAPVGFELSAKLTGTNHDVTELDPASIHTCTDCMEMELVIKHEASLKLKLLDLLSFEHKFTRKTKVGDLYYSIDNDEFAWGNCPYQAYRVTVQVEDFNKHNIPNKEIYVERTDIFNQVFWGITNKNGIAVDYLPAGEYTFVTTVNGETIRKNVKVEESCKVALIGTAVPSRPTIEADQVIDRGDVIDSGTCGEDVYWALYSNGLLNIWGSGNMDDYYYAVRSPWYGDSRVKSVYIRNGVTSIGEEAFSHLPSLTSATIPSSITCIGYFAFANCTNLSSVTIEEGVTKIGHGAFTDCSGLTHIAIPGSVGVLGYGGWSIGVFDGCTGLTSVTIRNGIERISSGTFAGCTSLTSITIPESVTDIEPGAFCTTGLTSLSVEKGNPVYHSAGNCIIETDSKTLVIGCKTSQIPSDGSVINIGRNAFYKCTGLTSISIPDSVTEIEGGAFADCTGLTSITIPDSVTTIGDPMFGECGGVFSGCTTLTSVTIGNGMTSIGDDAFNGCTSLTSVTIPNSVTSIGDCAFAYCENLTSITIPDGVSSVGDGTFYYCTNLTNITIPDSITSIGDTAFERCTSLTSITIPDSVTYIGYDVFYRCTGLKTIKFEGNMPNIGAYAFDDVTATAYYPANNATWTSDSLENYGGNITWVPYTIGSNGEMVTMEAEAVVAVASEEELAAASIEEEEYAPALEEELGGGISTFGIWGGEYETEETETYTLKTANFSGLVPGEQYVLLALVSTEVENLVAPENLLYIDQGTANEDGALAFTYVQRVDTNVSYVIACGATYNNLNDAEITFPEMAASEETYAVEPTVVFDGKILVEGVDYTIVGTVDYTAAGTYTCYIRGIYNYSGTVKCTYTVVLCAGDINGDGTLDHNDAIYLLLHTMFGEESYPINGATADRDGNGTVDQEDAVYLLLHTLFGEEYYPLKAN